MARILDLNLEASGRWRRAELTLTGTVEFEVPSRNGGEILATFRSNEGELIWNYVQWATRGRDDVFTHDDSRWTLRADGGRRVRFTLVARNTGSALRGRRFNEDRGKDEILAEVVVRDARGEDISEPVVSNQVRGRF